MTGTGRVAVLTGAAGGIGTAIARRLAASGWTLALADREAEGLRRLSSDLASDGAATSTHVVDLLTPGSPEDLRSAVLAEHGAVHLLVNNAGLTVLSPLEKQSREDVERVFGVNLVAVAQMCRVFAPALVESAPSSVVNIASFSGILAFPLQTTYSASKFGVRGLTQALRIELGDRGVVVSAVLPGSVATPLMRGAPTHDPALSQFFTDSMLRHGASPDRVAKAVLRCVERGTPEILVGWDAHFGVRLQRWLPAVVRRGFAMGWRRYRRSG